jgi:hypothetical protein
VSETVIRGENRGFPQKDDGDPAIARQGGIVREQRFGIRLAGDLIDPVRGDAGRLQDTP